MMYAVASVQPWSAITIECNGTPLPINAEMEGAEPCGFIPVFSTREPAVAFAPDARIIELRTEEPDAQA